MKRWALVCGLLMACSTSQSTTIDNPGDAAVDTSIADSSKPNVSEYKDDCAGSDATFCEGFSSSDAAEEYRVGGQWMQEGERAFLRRDTSTELCLMPTGDPGLYAAMTFDMSMRFAALPQGRNRAGIFDKGGAFGIFLHADGRLECKLNKDETNSIFFENVPLNQWHHIALSFDDSTFDCHLNGEGNVRAVDGNLVSNDALCIGENSPNRDEELIGDIDWFRIWTRKLPFTDIHCFARPETCPSE